MATTLTPIQRMNKLETRIWVTEQRQDTFQEELAHIHEIVGEKGKLSHHGKAISDLLVESRDFRIEVTTELRRQRKVIDGLAATQVSHTATLANHTETLANHTETLASHTETLASHTEMLASLSETQASHTEILTAIAGHLGVAIAVRSPVAV